MGSPSALKFTLCSMQTVNKLLNEKCASSCTLEKYYLYLKLFSDIFFLIRAIFPDNLLKNDFNQMNPPGVKEDNLNRI